MAKWRAFAKDPTLGRLVPGDSSVPPTRWWNQWYLAAFRWRFVATFMVPFEVSEAGYYVGFTDLLGRSWIKEEMQQGGQYSVKIGYEECRFFVVAAADNKIIVPQLIAHGPLH